MTDDVTRVLVTCPPMLGQRAHFEPLLRAAGVEPVCPDVVQTLTEDQLIALLPGVDGWIIGDDPATARVLEAGAAGRLRACVKWGIGTDNVDFAACERLGLAVTNTPGMFGDEVADVAMALLVSATRRLVEIDRGVRAGRWPKPAGRSLASLRVGLVGLGDIGRQIARRLLVAGADVIAWDPGLTSLDGVLDVAALTTGGAPASAVLQDWPRGLGDVDAIVLAAPLTAGTHHLLDADALARTRPGVLVVNVGRGPVVDETALVAALASGHVGGAAMDVFELEPLPDGSPLRTFDSVVLGSHNSSNTVDAVHRTNAAAVAHVLAFLGLGQVPA